MGKNNLQKELDAIQLDELRKTAKNDLCFIFATRLRELIIQKNINQEELAKNIVVSTGSISSYMKAKAEPKCMILLEIAKYFNVSTDYLLGNTDVKTTNTDIMAISEYTGLSEKAINQVIYSNTVNDNNTSYGISYSFNEFLENENSTVLMHHINHYIKCKKENTGDEIVKQLKAQLKSKGGRVIYPDEKEDLALFNAQNKFIELIKDMARGKNK